MADNERKVVIYRAKDEYNILGEYVRTIFIATKRVPIPEGVRCKFCGSNSLRRYGKYKGVQRYLCEDCGRKSAASSTLPKMQSQPAVIGSALSLFYEGLSLEAIRRHLWESNNIQPSKSTLYRWVERYTKVATSLASNLSPRTGRTWVVDETVINIGGYNVWFWDIIDAKTRFLIASHLSMTRGTRDAESLMKRAQDRVGQPPEFIISDKLAAYIDGIERVFGADTWHVRAQGLRGKINTNLIERFHGTLKSRTKVMRGLKTVPSAKLVLSGWLVNYNYLRPHESLGGRTPANMAGIRFPYAHWTDIVKSTEPRVRGA